MIQGGGWCRLKALEEHSKYARAALDFDSTADTVLMLDVTKSTVQLPPELRDELKPLIASLVGESESRYRASKREDHSIVQFKQTGVHKSAQEDVQRANNIRKDTTAPLANPEPLPRMMLIRCPSLFLNCLDRQ